MSATSNSRDNPLNSPMVRPTGHDKKIKSFYCSIVSPKRFSQFLFGALNQETVWARNKLEDYLSRLKMLSNKCRMRGDEIYTLLFAMDSRNVLDAIKPVKHLDDDDC